MLSARPLITFVRFYLVRNITKIIFCVCVCVCYIMIYISTYRFLQKKEGAGNILKMSATAQRIIEFIIQLGIIVTSNISEAYVRQTSSCQN